MKSLTIIITVIGIIFLWWGITIPRLKSIIIGIAMILFASFLIFDFDLNND
jgi:hypothetical protein